MFCRERPITVRPVCGGRRICIAPWLALVLTLVFIAVLCARCRTARTCVAQTATTVSDVSRETSETFLFGNLKTMRSFVSDSLKEEGNPTTLFRMFHVKHCKKI